LWVILALLAQPALTRHSVKTRRDRAGAAGSSLWSESDIFKSPGHWANQKSTLVSSRWLGRSIKLKKRC